MKPSGSTHRGNRRRGFALLEVLAAVALTAAFAAMVLPFVGRMVEQWWRGAAMIQDSDAWMQLTARLSADLAQAIPLPGTGQSGLAFRTSRDVVVFVRPARPGSEAGGLLISAYVIERTRSGDALVNYSGRFSPYLLDVDPRSFGTATAIMTGAFRFSFAPVGADGSRPERWSDRKDLPQRVELTVSPIADGAAPIPIALPIVAQAPKGPATTRATSQ
ncbi:prepilin-type N-terminal cleavage/methylation domain-containing protein [Tardiphaga sp.]|uniref:prepilin-type N-terminal cleavage/methylation domain-containing protein n=1 Tax=Tardiphaga sp. TaxID=1926292 RepID=UPI00352A319C